MKKLNTEEFIHKAQSVHGDKYDYSKVTYVNNSTNVCVICRDHGEFLQSPHNHLKGKGCPICGIQTNANKLRKNTEDFIREAIVKHGDKYDYSKVEYIDWKTKVCIICPEHGEFWQTPNNHLMGHGCPICKGNSIGKKLKSNTDTFIQQSMEIHGDKYDYSKVEYVNNHKKVCIICPEHGEFWQTPNVHLSKRGCPICGKEKRTQKITRKFSEYEQRARIIHHDFYKYNGDYTNAKNKIRITCPIHGDFYQEADSHLHNHGCPLCKSSKIESEVKEFLDELNVKYVYQKHFQWLGLQTLDFYLPEYNVAIECQGIQHFEPIEYFGGDDGFSKIQERDKIKLELCQCNGVRLLYYSNLTYDFPYLVLNNHNDLLVEIKKQG